jgi:hypothetical protein
MRQWGIAVQMYAGDMEDFFPDNLDTYGVVYAGTNVQKFWRDYLLPWAQPKIQKARNHVLFCPTDKLHRLHDFQEGLSENTPVFSGYYLLPHRDLERSRVRSDFQIAGIAEWHSRKKLGGEFTHAPILADKLQAWGRTTRNGVTEVMMWKENTSTGPVPQSNHAQKNGEPTGGNFLFEDGRVTWYRFSKIELGSKSKLDPGYLHFYKIPVQ